ncbi:glycolipid transfer protein (gltp), putative [Schistosoma mansoni]|uniref:glycolipid transfer protein (gltp), putative n=1 Tax=Schistosoma mansoni TaxID=6183 RepID=UPI00022C87CE|nr:glycolipid transfer protein (gltp), putative [Schistosoma mansoni]|eukprot:XP_018646652.1 glycolipid transfer protein (gltp), putative [Schistosoma mansoni]
MGHSDNASLNLYNVYNKFKACVNGDDVLLPEYCEAYTEVSKLLVYFGNLFYFVTSDVSHKVSELRDLYAADKINYKSVEQMVLYEEKQNEHLPVKKRKCVGSRTLLRLHRALLFVIDLMQEICRGKLRAPPDEQLKTMARSVYDKTLAQYHPWPIRKAVGVAVYALPTREHLVHHIVQSQPPESGLLTNEQCSEFLTSHTLPVMRKVYNCIQAVFEKHDMLNLP